MATTVTYKGSTLTTATNQTKILKTAGKYMEDDVTIEDVTSGGSAVVVTEELDAGGGIIKHITAIDLSNDTVDAAHLYQGYTAHNFQGEAIVGTMSGGGTTINNQNKTVTPTTAQQSVTYDNGYTGLGVVTVQAMPSGTAGTPTAAKSAVSNHTITITPSVTNSAGYISSGTKTGTAVTVSAGEVVSGTLNITTNGTKDVTNYASVSVNVSGGGTTLQSKSVSFTPTESAQTSAVTPDTGYDGLSEVNVSVAAVSSTYVGSGITRNPTMTVSGATVTAPIGYYSTAQSKSVASGTAGTPTATKGTVSNHSISVTPSVTNTTGYITGGTKTGTAATVSASELVSGTLNVTTNGTQDVTNYASVSVNVPNPSYNVTVFFEDADDPNEYSTDQTYTISSDDSISFTMKELLITPGASPKTYSYDNPWSGVAGAYYVWVAGDANLVGSNILSGKSIFGVDGTVTFQTYYTGSTTPAASLGSNGDIYLQS